jgi:hypothetical protein
MAIDLDDVIKRVREQLGPPPSDLADLERLHSAMVGSLLSASAHVDSAMFPEFNDRLITDWLIGELVAYCEARNNDGSPCRYRRHPDATPYCRIHWPTKSRGLMRRGELWKRKG